MHQKSITG